MLNGTSLYAMIGTGGDVGSFNFNLHAQCSNADRVAKGIREVLAASGWRPSQVPPDESSRRWEGSSNRRAFWISQPVSGWTSILDSDVAGAMALSPPLAAELDAYTLFCMVNDSDSWQYSLADKRGVVDEFDSAAGDADERPSDELSAAEPGLQASNLARFQHLAADGSFPLRMAEVQERFLASAPPEIQEIQAELKGGKIDTERLQRYHAWMSSQLPLMTKLIQEAMGDALNLPKAVTPAASVTVHRRKRSRTNADRAATKERIDKLRPLLAPGVSALEVESVLTGKAIFAEETLAKFLPLVGIPAFYAYLDYDHKDEASPEELSAQGIEFAHHLMFELPSV